LAPPIVKPASNAGFSLARRRELFLTIPSCIRTNVRGAGLFCWYRG
jgi:hypothetical protein